ncbi:MAG: molybdate ABC transporter substrate-binding protein [Anaerolineaceae bacterium]|nr:molybdate ABC transporter substrate-binding protein [Anaerolineaceae bacterium]
MIRSLFLFAILLTLAAAVIPGAPARQEQTLTVFAASSLTDAFEEIGTAFEAANPGAEVLFSFAGSATLATQLVEGAPVDIFASANNTQMQVVMDEGLVIGTPDIFAQNRLVLIIPSDNPAEIQNLHDLANEGVQLVVAAPAVPVREYTNLMLERMAADCAYGDIYREHVVDNIVSEEDNVRQVTAKVALGEADAGIVYLSDVTPDVVDDVRIIDIPDHLNTIATYPIAIINSAADPALAQSFVDFVQSDEGQAILVEWHFVSVQATEPTPEVTPENLLTPESSPTPCGVPETN